MPSVEQLVEKHGKDTVSKAFWLQEHIFHQGVEPVHFTDKAESEMRQQGPMRVKNRIENEFTKSI